MQKRVWIKSGIVEELDAKQMRLLDMVYEKIVFYYKHLHGTRPCYQHPLSLSRLKKLCNRSNHAVSLALRYLANTVRLGSDGKPLISYDRIGSEKNSAHRPYRIWLRKLEY